tara:strand:+ start:671 stop:886 length:216 start_codon:yes stop_codon:yes gene_type:complete
MTIHEIKRRTKETAPYFFERKTLEFFGQAMRSFKVTQIDETHFEIRAPRRGGGETIRIFDTETNELNLQED